MTESKRIMLQKKTEMKQHVSLLLYKNSLWLIFFNKSKCSTSFRLLLLCIIYVKYGLHGKITEVKFASVASVNSTGIFSRQSQKNHQRCSINKAVVKNSQYLQENTFW